MKIFLLLFIYLGLALSPNAQNLKGSNWADQLGAGYSNDEYMALIKDRTDLVGYSNRIEQMDLSHVLFSRNGIDVEFLIGNSLVVTGITYGTAEYFETIFEKSKLAVDQAVSYDNALPFDLMLGSALELVEEKIGKLSLSAKAGYPTITTQMISDLPGLDHLYLTLEFIDDKLAGLEVKITSSWSQNIDKNTVSQAALKKAMSEKNFVLNKLNFASVFQVIKNATQLPKDKSGLVNTSTNLQWHRDQLKADSVMSRTLFLSSG